MSCEAARAGEAPYVPDDADGHGGHDRAVMQCTAMGYLTQPRMLNDGSAPQDRHPGKAQIAMAIRRAPSRAGGPKRNAWQRSLTCG